MLKGSSGCEAIGSKQRLGGTMSIQTSKCALRQRQESKVTSRT